MNHPNILSPEIHESIVEPDSSQKALMSFVAESINFDPSMLDIEKPTKRWEAMSAEFDLGTAHPFLGMSSLKVSLGECGSTYAHPDGGVAYDLVFQKNDKERIYDELRVGVRLWGAQFASYDPDINDGAPLYEGATQIETFLSYGLNHEDMDFNQEYSRRGLSTGKSRFVAGLIEGLRGMKDGGALKIQDKHKEPQKWLPVALNPTELEFYNFVNNFAKPTREKFRDDEGIRSLSCSEYKTKSGQTMRTPEYSFIESIEGQEKTFIIPSLEFDEVIISEGADNTHDDGEAAGDTWRAINYRMNGKIVSGFGLYMYEDGADPRSNGIAWHNEYTEGDGIESTVWEHGIEEDDITAQTWFKNSLDQLSSAIKQGDLEFKTKVDPAQKLAAELLAEYKPFQD